MLFPTLNVLYLYISTFRSLCAVPSMAVFCTSFISCYPGRLLGYFLSDFEVVPADYYYYYYHNHIYQHVCW